MTNERLEALKVDPKILGLGDLVFLLFGMVWNMYHIDGLKEKGINLDGEREAMAMTIQTLMPKYQEELNRREREYKSPGQR